MAATDCETKRTHDQQQLQQQKAEGMLHISLVGGVGGDTIAEGTWHRSCKMLELFKIAYRSTTTKAITTTTTEATTTTTTTTTTTAKPGIQIKLLHGSLKLSPQMSLDIFDGHPGAICLTVIYTKAAKKQQLCSLRMASAAIKRDGSVVTWGLAAAGGDSSSVADKLQEGVVQVVGIADAFTAIKDDGSVVTWGEAGAGGDSSSVADKLNEGVVQVAGTYGAFAAIKDDGSVITWGTADSGGDSSSVADKLQEGVVQ
ncbi:unnamed protein product, partial [Polarella glacialis]